MDGFVGEATPDREEPSPIHDPLDTEADGIRDEDRVAGMSAWI